ncbi:hypothetical protein [Mycetocola spongiae]|uniref:hypothetical protein n=1 Tax=Mycetocola spongiae TaxID=2859226 RepID=UPI001CF4C6C3|nr:hypothetical protein [Mycetocola spongiae]UCR88538.1 hypothetical protein KXZ72_11300 [Mycetocola spongiae]
MSETINKKTGRKRIYVAGGALLAVAALATTAAFNDFANLNIGNGTDDSGIGGNNRFNIQVVATDAAGAPILGQWQEADTADGVNIAVPGADTLTPGDTISVDIPFRNESPKLSADIDLSLNDRAGKVSDPEMVAALRYSVVVNGVSLLSNGTQAQFNAIDAGTFTAGTESSVRLSISLPDQGSEAANNALSEKVSFAQLHFNADSVTP